jgi:hypothetical protein
MWKSAHCLLAGLLLAGGLGACAVVDTVDPRYDTINRAAAKARNEGILLNIVRASRNLPLNFIAFSKVVGSTSAGSNFGLPQFGVGPSPLVFTVNRQAVFSNSVLGGNMRADNSFDITLLESQGFYNGLLSPVDLPTINFFVRQGYSRELLFWLFTESARETVGGRTYEYRNDPDPSIACDNVRGHRRCFQDMVDISLGSGLTVETLTQRPPAGGKATVLGRLCFDPVLAARAQREYPPEVARSLMTTTGHRPRCRIDPWAHELKTKTNGENDTLTFEAQGTPAGTLRYEILTRSTFGIYQFLGRILATGANDLLRLRGLRATAEDTRLLSVVRTSPDGCFVDLGFEGDFYCVPREGAENTKRIFSLLAQLIALKTAPGDLAITPNVRTIN